MDSIVDSFFPLLKEIEKELVAIDDLVFSNSDQPLPVGDHQAQTSASGQIEKVDTTGLLQLPEKIAAEANNNRIRFSSSRTVDPLLVRQFGHPLKRIWDSLSATSSGSQPNATRDQFTLRRIARIRKLVTSLTRLLATKSEVVARIRKRFLLSNQYGLHYGASKDEDFEVSMYMGDVQGVSVFCFSPCCERQTLIRMLVRSYINVATFTCSL